MHLEFHNWHVSSHPYHPWGRTTVYSPTFGWVLMVKYGFHVGFPKTKKSLKSDECVMEKMKSDWLFQPSWKLCSSNWILSPGIGVKIPKIFELPPPRWTCVFPPPFSWCTSWWFQPGFTEKMLEIIQVAKASEVELSGFTGWDVSSWMAFSCDAMASCDVFQGNRGRPKITSWWLSFNPSEKICASQNGYIFPNFRGENSKHSWVATT